MIPLVRLFPAKYFKTRIFPLLIGFLGANHVLGQLTPTVQTEFTDYPPGAIVNITGSGWDAAGDSVTLQVIHVGDTGDNNISGAHTPWKVKVNADGTLESTWTVPLDEDELGATLLLTADQGGVHAEWTFTDANVTFSLSGLPAGSYSITVTYRVYTTSGGPSGSFLSLTFSYPGPSSPGIAVNNSQTIQYSFSTVTIGGLLYSAPGGSAVGANNGNGGQSISAVYSASCPVIAAPTPASATPASICIGGSSNLNATSAGNTIRWFTVSTGGTSIGTSASGANFPVSPLVTTTYFAEAVNAAGCVSATRTSVTVTVNALPVCSINGTSGPVCPSSSSIYSAPAGMASYLWEVINGNATIAAGEEDNQSATVTSGSDCNSSYTLKLTITNSSGCVSTCTKIVTVKDETPPSLTGTAYSGVSGINSCKSDAVSAAPFDASKAIQGYSDNCSSAVIAELTNTDVSGTDCSWSITYTY
ncbi:MAG TPA: hypothetical protein VFN30_07210, partial [Chitinophagaceae bacterium]|nr:hypothetical protein [Chitinophagaceae bacterium]